MTIPTPVKVLLVGGTGIISASCARRALDEGLEVFVLNRGRSVSKRPLPDGVVRLVADVGDSASVAAALGDLHFDAIVNFVSFTLEDTEAAIELFRGRTEQYIHISTASIYRKPILRGPLVESNLRRNALLPYAQEKILAEDRLMQAYVDDGFPVTIVRPSHTYDETNPPLPGDWTVFDRIERGDEIVVPGDGTSLWTLTHAADFAIGLVGLLANPRAIGEAFHITSDDVYTWDQIYTIVAQALGREANLVHVPSEMITLAAPDWFWSEFIAGDLAHSAVYDNTKVRRYVPGFTPTQTFHRTAHRMVRWRAEHPEFTAGDPTVDGIIGRLATGYRQSREIFAALTPKDAR